MTPYQYKLNRRSLELIHKSSIRPLMEYVAIVLPGGNIGDLESIQLDAARVVTGATARCSTSLLIEDVGWPTSASRRRAHRLTLFYKILNGLSPPYLINLLPQRVHERTRYPLRSPDNFTL